MSASTARIPDSIGFPVSADSDVSQLMQPHEVLWKKIEAAIHSLRDGQDVQRINFNARKSLDKKEGCWYPPNDVVRAINAYLNDVYNGQFQARAGICMAVQQEYIISRKAAQGPERKQSEPIVNESLQPETRITLLDKYLERERVPEDQVSSVKQAISLLVRGAKAQERASLEEGRPVLGRHTARVRQSAELKDVPPLPSKSPKRWVRDKLDGETPPEFIQRIYVAWLGEGVPKDRRLPRSLLGTLDGSLYKALRAWEVNGGVLPDDFGFVPRAKTTPEELEAFKRGEVPYTDKSYVRLSKAMKKLEKDENSR